MLLSMSGDWPGQSWSTSFFFAMKNGVEMEVWHGTPDDLLHYSVSFVVGSKIIQPVAYMLVKCESETVEPLSSIKTFNVIYSFQYSTFKIYLRNQLKCNCVKCIIIQLLPKMPNLMWSHRLESFELYAPVYNLVGNWIVQACYTNHFNCSVSVKRAWLLLTQILCYKKSLEGVSVAFCSAAPLLVGLGTMVKRQTLAVGNQQYFCITGWSQKKNGQLICWIFSSNFKLVTRDCLNNDCL